MAKKTVVYKVGGKATTRLNYENAKAEGRTDIERIEYNVMPKQDPKVADNTVEDDVDMDEVVAEMNKVMAEMEEEDMSEKETKVTEAEGTIREETEASEASETNDEPEKQDSIVASNSDEKKENKNHNLWVIALLIMVLALAGHLIWCLEHHMDEKAAVNPTAVVNVCTACNKIEPQCECLEIRSDLVRQIATLQAQLNQQATPVGTSAPVIKEVRICGICGGQQTTCECATKYNIMKAQAEKFNQMMASGKCYGFCSVHCNHTATATPKPTKAPTATATATPKPTKAPTATATPKPTQTTCQHPSTVQSNGNKVWNGANWTQKFQEICANCGVVVKSWTESGCCNHPSTHEEVGEKENFGDRDWLQEVKEICNTCGTTVDSWYNGGSYENITIPSNNNSWEYDDDGEAAKPV